MERNWLDKISEASLHFACYLASQSDERGCEMKRRLPYLEFLLECIILSINNTPRTHIEKKLICGEMRGLFACNFFYKSRRRSTL